MTQPFVLPFCGSTVTGDSLPAHVVACAKCKAIAQQLERGPSGAGAELERGSSGANSGAPRGTSERRILHARQLVPFDTARQFKLPAMPPHPPDDGAARPKWNSKWEFQRAGKRVRIVVVANGPDGREETLDAREFIERLAEDHSGTTFAIHVETEQI